MVFDRPKKPGSNRPSPATQRPSAATQRPQRPGNSNRGRRNDGGGNGGGRGRGGGNGRGGFPEGQEPPSPWLEHPADSSPSPHDSASFVEYLRWMRSPDSEYKDSTKVQLLQLAEEQGDYSQQLKIQNKRTELIAGNDNVFSVTCPWRIRVGGHRGPESILLPAFDALGMPYIPSSTLRGIARTQAIRSIMAEENKDWKKADADIAKYFGDINSKEKANRSGKVIFLDAYPMPEASGSNGGLAMDMANNIWSWDAAGRALNYSPNPNPFFSLQQPTFLIGLKPASNCKDKMQEKNVLEKVRGWLLKGLAKGAGSQINSGYGQLLSEGQNDLENKLFDVKFTLEGQLIHGHQRFINWSWSERRNVWQMRGQPNAEVRSIAIKSMLRYWFRMFSFSVLTPPKVQTLEAKLFGAITPPAKGWATFQIINGQVDQREARPFRDGKNDPCGQQSGHLIITRSSEADPHEEDALASLFKTLTWMMFHLGGVGQGARRPCYSRKSRERAPWWRGATLIAESEEPMWELPDTVNEFQLKFQKNLQTFYRALEHISGERLNYRQPQTVSRVSRDRWSEAVDASCRIVVCEGQENYGKPYALAMLHSQDLKVNNRRGQLDYDPNLCGRVQGGVKPSPVWICDLGDYQVASVFGATQDPRRQYLQTLRSQADTYKQIWPF